MKYLAAIPAFLLFCLSAAQAREPVRVDTWFESGRRATQLLDLAARVIAQKSLFWLDHREEHVSRVCPRERYLRILRATRIEWEETGPAETSAYRAVPSQGSASAVLRMNLGAWKAASSDAERMAIAVPAILEACAPGRSPASTLPTPKRRAA